MTNLLVDIIRSFYTNMEARIRVDEELLEKIEMNNGLRQGCTMAPTLFNLYAGVVAEKQTEAMQDVKDVGMELLYKLDQQLFRRSTRGASEVTVDKEEFADDVVLVASTREAAQTVGKAWTPAGCGMTDEDRLPLPLDDGGTVEHVSQFPYLGFLIAESGWSHEEGDRRIASGSRAFWALRRAVFKDSNLSVKTKRSVYNACVMSVLLYGSECWVLLRRDL